MIRLILVAAVFAAICNCFVDSALARGNNMQFYDADGSLAWPDDDEFTISPTVPAPTKRGSGSAEDRLKQAKQLFDKGLISEKEYQTKRSEIRKGL